MHGGDRHARPYVSSPSGEAMIRIYAAFLALGLSAQALPAAPLSLPGNAVLSAEVPGGVTTLAFPAGPWDGARVPVREAEGRLRRTAWRLRGQMMTPLQIVDFLRPQLERDGWETVFECRDAPCGGYDFRFASNTLPAPGMYVDLGNYRYLLAERGDGALLSLMVSRSGETAHVQATEVDPVAAEAPALVTSSKSRGAPAGDLAAALEGSGRAALDALAFPSGAATLDEAGISALDAVAAYLADNPAQSFAIVGHTDSEGGLDGNIALSERRARSVRRALIDRYGIPPDQIDARGIGYLAPRGPNDTEEGRIANRRVEIVRTE